MSAPDAGTAGTPLLLGHYRIVGKIGEGGMGVVYRARDEHLERDIALKVLPPGTLITDSARRSFHKEALALSRLNHPNIATVHDFDVQSGIEYLVMEFVSGMTLHEKLANGPLPEKDILRLGLQLCDGLGAAHSQGVIHRDLKPGNIVVTTDGRLKILDFGLAKLVQPVSAHAPTESLASDSHFAGTLPYMAPEQLRGENVDVTTDIWAAGTVLYEMSTGERPFRAPGVAVVDEILHAPPLLPTAVNRELSRGLEAIILKCLDRDPDNRYQSAKELAVDLRRLSTTTTSSTAVRAGAASRSYHRRRSAVYGSIVVTLALLAVILVVLVVQPGRRASSSPAPHWVLVGDFENRTGEAVFDRTVRELLLTDLEQSSHINIVPPARIEDALKHMERSADARIDEVTGREICLREGLQALVIGSISRIGARYLVVIRAISPRGDLLLSAQNEAGSAEQVPHTLDTISQSLRTTLGESHASVAQTSLPLAQVTSPSLAAVDYFSTAKQLLYAGLPRQAITFLQQAVELDRNFAMAYEYQGIAYLHLGDPIRARDCLRKATLAISHVSEREKHKILGDYYLLAKDYDRAIAEFQVLAHLYPQDAAAHLNLGQSLLGKFDFQHALDETEEAVRLDPQPVLPLTNVADIYLLAGRVDRGIATAEQVLRSNPEQQRALYDLARGFLGTKRIGDAGSVFDRISKHDGEMQADAYAALGDLALSRGRFKQATSALQTAIVLDDRNENLYGAVSKTLQLASAYQQEGAIQQFVKIMRQLNPLVPDAQLLMLAGALYAQSQRLDEAEKMLVLLQRQADQDRVPTLNSWVEVLRARIEMARGDNKRAVESAEAAVREENSTLAVETLGHAYRLAGKYTDAIQAFESVLARSNERIESYDRPAFHHIVETHYYLGVLYQQIGQTDRSRGHLNEFLNSWNDPDTALEIYIDAKRRLEESKRVTSRGGGTPTPAT